MKTPSSSFIFKPDFCNPNTWNGNEKQPTYSGTHKHAYKNKCDYESEESRYFPCFKNLSDNTEPPQTVKEHDYQKNIPS